jgi:endonuclease YncB( thermonuclease family)
VLHSTKKRLEQWILFADEHNSYIAYAKTKGIPIKQIPSGKHKVRIYHIQHVNSYRSQLKGWMKRFNGVATKYLNNYLYWFKWLTLRKGLRERDNSQKIVATSYMVDYTIRWSDFKLITEPFP